MFVDNFANKLLFFILKPENDIEQGQLERSEWQYICYGVLSNILTGIFTYGNMERSRIRLVEKSYFHSSYVGAFNDDTTGVIVAPITPVGKMNNWGMYSSYDVLLPDGTTKRMSADELVVGYSYNIPTIPDSLLCWKFAEVLAELKVSIENGIILSRKSAMIEVDDENMVDEVLTAFNNHRVGAPVTIKKSRKGGTSTNVMEFTNPTTITSYYDNVRDVLNEFLTVTGLSSLVNPNKKERLLDNEISSNEDIKNTLLTNRIENREDFIKEVNDRFGTNWEVSVDPSILAQVEELQQMIGGVEDGTTENPRPED